MKHPGQIVLVPFPYADPAVAKLRPVLLLRRASTRFDDWVVCMVSSQIQQAEPGFDEIVSAHDADFPASGLKTESVIRISRLAVIDGALLTGSIGEIGSERLRIVRRRLAVWIGEE